MYPETCSGAPAGVLPCDPRYRRTTPPLAFGLLPAGRLARRSTTVRSWFFHFQEPTPEPAWRRRAASVLPLHDVAVLPLTVRTAGLFRTPSPPALSDPAPLLPERRSPTDGTAASDRHTSTQEHALEVEDPQHLARSADSGFRLHDPFTTRASQLGANLADHFEPHRFNFQHL